jgi:formylglycine-generating enzyme required for sulfatase activity
MKAIPAGHFMMGSPESEPGRQAAEGPRHRVSIAHAFAIGTYDVTVAEYGRFVAATGYEPANPRCDWRNPTARGTPIKQTAEDRVVCVSWTDAVAYTRWHSEMSGHPYRLPTEAEWEYAARAGTTSARPWGPDPDPGHANTGADECCAPHTSGGDRWLYTSPVGSFPSNDFGLFDMLGNVWQWTMDCGPADYQKPVIASPDPLACGTHVARGGGWFHPPQMARSAARVVDDANLRVVDIGFRVARALP